MESGHTFLALGAAANASKSTKAAFHVSPPLRTLSLTPTDALKKSEMDSETTSREMSEEDRQFLVQLIEQIGKIAEGLEKLKEPDKQVPHPVSGESVFRFDKLGAGIWGKPVDGSKRLIRSSPPKFA